MSTPTKAEVGDLVRIKVGNQTGKIGEVHRLIRRSRRGTKWYEGRLVARTISTIAYQVQLLDGGRVYSLPSGHFTVIKRAQ